MKALIQRVSFARVEIEGETTGEIGKGLLVFLCAVKEDAEKDLDYMARKISQLRIFEDDEGKMNLSVRDVNGGALVVSQFTLAASVRRGNRPSFDNAESPERAREMYERFVQKLKETKIPVQTGLFAETMAVSLTNAGPVTIWIDSRESNVVFFTLTQRPACEIVFTGGGHGTGGDNQEKIYLRRLP